MKHKKTTSLIDKLKRDLISLKLWLSLLATTLLWLNKLHSSDWVIVVLSLAGLREASELRNNKYGESNGPDE